MLCEPCDDECGEHCCQPPWQSDRRVVTLLNASSVKEPVYGRSISSASCNIMMRAIDNAVSRKECVPSWDAETWCVLLQHVESMLEKNLRKHSLLRQVDSCKSAIVFGDLHGQYSTLQNWLRVLGHPRENPDCAYVFCGDYVDRGPQSLETAASILCLSAENPNVCALRGNHELKEINFMFGLSEELIKRFGMAKGKLVWSRLNSAFETLPIMARIGTSTLCMHGGIHADLDLNALSSVKTRVSTITPNGEAGGDSSIQNSSFYNVLWSDPKPSGNSMYGKSSRGGGIVTYSPEAVDEFFDRHGIKDGRIFRAHQVVDGFADAPGHDRVHTVFSAPFAWHSHMSTRSKNIGGVVQMKLNSNGTLKSFKPRLTKKADAESDEIYD